MQPARDEQHVAVAPAVLRVGHLPFLSRRRVAKKSWHGAQADAAGLPPSTSWHVRLIHAFDRDDRLDDFWESHSIGASVAPTGRTLPTTVEDPDLVAALAAPLTEAVERQWMSRDLDVTGANASPRGDTTVPLRELVRLTNRHQQLTDDGARARNDLVIRLDTENARSVALAREVDRLAAALARVAEQREEDLAVAVAERNAVVNSRSWRSTALLRWFGARVRRGPRAVRRP